MQALETRLATLEASLHTVEAQTIPTLEKSVKKEVRCVLGPTVAAANSLKNKNTSLHSVYNQLEKFRHALTNLQ